MDRRSVILTPLFLAGCATQNRNLADLLPHESGGWKRGDIQTPTAIPEVAQTLGVTGSAEALYVGEGRVRVRVFQMKSETTAFELMQKWRHTDGLAAYKGPYFFIAAGEAGSTPQHSMTLLALLQKNAAQ